MIVLVTSVNEMTVKPSPGLFQIKNVINLKRISIFTGKYSTFLGIKRNSKTVTLFQNYFSQGYEILRLHHEQTFFILVKSYKTEEL